MAATSTPAMSHHKAEGQQLFTLDKVQSAASQVALCIKDLHQIQGALTPAFLKARGITITDTTTDTITDTDTAATSDGPWLPSPAPHDQLELLIQSFVEHDFNRCLLRPPADLRPYPGAPSNTALEWAQIFHDTTSLLSDGAGDTQTSMLPARPRLPDAEDPWEGMLANGAYESQAWEMVTVYETGPLVSCIVADSSSNLSGHQDGLFRSELYSLLALLHRQLSRAQGRSTNGLEAVTVTTFTRSTVRVQQAYVNYAQKPREIHIIKRLDIKVEDMVGGQCNARSRWLDVLSWLHLMSGITLHVNKRQAGDGCCYESERQFSGSSASAEPHGEWPSESSSEAST
ncbi:hypothetical protein ColTof4_14410 [Colletotrichum tofieldiae]|nr:hypothetical protein ColTof3_14870 [Colletotrichum tofieldiae]GKT81987.1 hypothetical protein ColTof4_14410 [Colletotrichum tofieldiae]